VDLAAESRVKLARNNKVPRPRARRCSAPWPDSLFLPESSIMTRRPADPGFIFSLSILVSASRESFTGSGVGIPIRKRGKTNGRIHQEYESK